MVTYVIIRNKNALLTFRRGVYSRVASFLRGSRCVGFGGHVVEDDFSMFSLSDMGVSASALRELYVVVPPGRIAVTVDHGIVTLAGQVDWKYQRDEVEADVWKLTGVKDVVNAVKVRPRPQSTDVHERIRKALERSADVEASHISVSVKDGKAVLTGTVGAWIERQTAEGAAWAAPGVTAVENRIQIGRP